LPACAEKESGRCRGPFGLYSSAILAGANSDSGCVKRLPEHGTVTVTVLTLLSCSRGMPIINGSTCSLTSSCCSFDCFTFGRCDSVRRVVALHLGRGGPQQTYRPDWNGRFGRFCGYNTAVRRSSCGLTIPVLDIRRKTVQTVQNGSMRAGLHRHDTTPTLDTAQRSAERHEAVLDGLDGYTEERLPSLLFTMCVCSIGTLSPPKNRPNRPFGTVRAGLAQVGPHAFISMRCSWSSGVWAS
jgi:hypothetical protein